MKLLKKILIGTLSFLVTLVTSLWISFMIWKHKVISELPGNSHVIMTSKGAIEYVISGNSDKYVLFLHGTPGSCQTIPDVDFYTKNGYSIISPSRPGYYRTPLSTGKTPKEQADAFASLLDELGIDSVIVSVISGSGQIGLQMAIDHPDKCKALILTSAITKGYKASPNGKSIIQYISETNFGIWLGSRLAKLILPDTYNRKDISILVNKGMFPYEMTKEGKENDSFNHHNFHEMHLHQIDVPTLIIHGDKDNLVPLDQALYASKGISNSELYILKGKNHFFNMTPFNDTVQIRTLSFLKSISN